MLCFGSELTSGARLNTHLQYLGKRLEDLGFQVRRCVTLPDDLALTRQAFTEALERADLILATGGLGPTEDDLTRQGLALALGLPLAENPAELKTLKAKIHKKFRKHMPMLRVQASGPRGCSFLPNRRGTAPGLYLPWQDRVICVLPGPPEEMKPMFEAEAVPRIRRDLPGLPASASAVVRTWGLREAEIQAKIGRLFTVEGPLRVAMTIYEGGVDLRVRGYGPRPGPVKKAVLLRAARMARLLGSGVYARAEEEQEEVIGRALRRAGRTLVVAESCTGGLLGEMFTRVPGSSDWFLGGAIAYHNNVKKGLLGVPESVLEKFGAVSEQAALAMASGARAAFSSDYGLSITGVAGPDGGTKEKPVGLVWVGLALPGGRCLAREHRFKWDRRTNRTLAARAAMDLLRRARI